RLVDIEGAVQQLEVSAVLAEQRAGKHVAQEKYDADHLVGFDASRDDALGQTLGVGLQRLEGSRLQGIEVVVVDGRGLREYLVPAHRGESSLVVDPPRPFVAKLGAAL